MSTEPEIVDGIITEDSFDDHFNPIGTDEDGVLVELLHVDDGESLRSRLGIAGLISDAEQAAMDFSKDHFGLGKERADELLRHIWTVTDCDGDLYAAPGFHYVNRLNLVVTEKPWQDEGLTAAYYVSEPDDDDELDDEPDSEATSSPSP